MTRQGRKAWKSMTLGWLLPQVKSANLERKEAAELEREQVLALLQQCIGLGQLSSIAGRIHRLPKPEQSALWPFFKLRRTVLQREAEMEANTLATSAEGRRQAEVSARRNRSLQRVVAGY